MISPCSQLLAWIEQGAIPRHKINEALRVANVTPNGANWLVFLDRLLLWLGGLSIAAATLFFIAYNWAGKRSGQTPPKGLLGKAISYALNQWDRLQVYLEEPLLTPDNNPAENAIRPFVLGRKNWLFAGPPKAPMPARCSLA